MYVYIGCDMFNSAHHKITMNSLKYIDSSYCPVI